MLQELFRQVMRRWISGISVITAAKLPFPMGMTMNSLTSVSLTPPLVLFCLGQASQRAAFFQKAPYWGVNILSDHQQDLALAFAAPYQEEGGHIPKPYHTYDLSPNGCAFFKGCQAYLEIQPCAFHPAGDHLIVISEVKFAQLGNPPSLPLYGNLRRSP